MLKNREVQPDYRIVKVEQSGMCDPTWVKEKGIESCGVFYLVDANLHVHICSFTPNLEAWPLHAYATFHTDEQAEADEGETEFEMMASEEACSYFGTEILNSPNRPATDYVDIPGPDYFDLDDSDEQGAEDYRMAVADYVRERLCGNPVWFT